MEATLLQLAILVPAIASLVLLLGVRESSAAQRVAWIGFLFPFAAAIFLAYKFYVTDVGAGDYLFTSKIDTGLEFVGISLHLGINAVSMPLLLLSGIVGLAAGIYAIYSQAERLNLYLGLLLMMQAGLVGAFSSVDIFFFYFFHELALIPTFIMIGIWGGQGRRQAAIEMTVYLTLGAMLSLIGLIAIYAGNPDIGSFDLISLKSHLAETGVDVVLKNNVFGLLLFGFGILVSLFPFHSWAPKGYAAAPSSAAMLHAGVLKKFGLYGLVQIAVPLLPAGMQHWDSTLIWLALGNILIIGFVTMAQRDLKMMLGYSSVMHMGYAFLGIATMSVIGVGGAVLLMFAHGLSTALLFMLATSIFRRTRTYDMHEMGGLGQKAPILAGFFVAATMAGIGLPGFANFWGELTIFTSLWNDHKCTTVLAITGIVISAIYGLRAVARIFFGEPTDGFKERFNKGDIQDVQFYERVPAALLVAGLLFAGLWPSFFTGKLNEALKVHYTWQNAAAVQQETVEPPVEINADGILE